MNAEKPEEQIAKEKAAVAAMKGAQTNMQFAISRIETLERVLKNQDFNLTQLRTALGEGLYASLYPVKSNEKTQVNIRTFIDSMRAVIAEVMP